MRVLAITTVLLLLSASCTRTVYEPVETVRTEHIEADTASFMRIIAMLREQLYSRDRTIDSLMQSYREHVTLNDRGDTLRVYVERIVYRSSHRESELELIVASQSDSIRELKQQLASVKTDSIPVPYPVEKQLTRWEQTKMDFGGMAIGATALSVIFVIIWLIKRYARHS